MKNYFVILFSLVVLSAQSQSIELFYNNELVVDTLTINVPNTETDHYIDIANVSENDIDLMISREIISLLPDAENHFCFGNCYNSSVDETPESTLLGAGVTFTKESLPFFYTAYDPYEEIGTSIIKYTFYDMNNPNDRASVVFKFVSNGVGICNSDREMVSVFEAYPNPTSSNVIIKHNFINQDVENAQIVISSLTGAVIETIKVNPFESETTLNISDLSQGVYFYSLQADGKTSVTKKLIVK